jgi:hypothetical protein
MFHPGKLAALLLVVSVSALAHHSFAAEYDNHKPAELKGKFISLDWVNPHAWLHLAVTGAGGKVDEWRCEMPPPNSLYHSGWTREMLKAGDEITASGFLAKNGTHTLWLQSVTLPNGLRMSARSAP